MSRSEKPRGQVSDVQLGLASPLLEEELFVAETALDLEPGAAALLNESPYAQAFEWRETSQVEAAVATPIGESAQVVDETEQTEALAQRRHRLSEPIEEAGYAEEVAEELGALEAGDLPFSLEPEIPPNKLLRGSQGEARSLGSLGDELAKYLGGLDRPHGEGGVCVAASLRYFAEACAKVGVRSLAAGSFKVKLPPHSGALIKFDLRVPAVVRTSGALINRWDFLALWFSNFTAKEWSKRLPAACRGAGAPGALLYADLVEGGRLLTASGRWPEDLRPGALLQLWKNEATYKTVRNPEDKEKKGKQFWGHSCIYRGHADTGQTTILLADQNGLSRQARWQDGTIHIWSYSRMKKKTDWLNLGMDFVIAANLSRYELLSPKSAEVGPDSLPYLSESRPESASLSEVEEIKEPLEEEDQAWKPVEGHLLEFPEDLKEQDGMPASTSQSEPSRREGALISERMTESLEAELSDEDSKDSSESYVEDTEDLGEEGELDPKLMDLAGKIFAREAPLEQQVSTRWTKCFSATDVAKVQKVYEDNASAASSNAIDRCSCIVMLNVALGQLLPLRLRPNLANGKSERRLRVGDLTTETIEKAMQQLRRKGLAGAPTVIEFLDRRDRTAGTLRPERLKTSVRDKVLEYSRPKGCWFAFGLSVMDGYHSVLLLVDHTTADARIWWLDQWSNGLNIDVTDNLDQRLTEGTQKWWQHVMDEDHKGYKTTIHLWPLRKPWKAS